MIGRFFFIGLLILALLGSAVSVVYARHESRKLFVELQGLEKERDELNVEWGRLQLEQGAWSSHGRVEQIAREKLSMRIPSSDNTVIYVP